MFAMWKIEVSLHDKCSNYEANESLPKRIQHKTDWMVFECLNFKQKPWSPLGQCLWCVNIPNVPKGPKKTRRR